MTCACIEKSCPQSAQAAADCLAQKKVAILPTDTVYGLSAVVDFTGDDGSSCDKLIRTIKGRDEGKPFIKLIAAPEEVWRYTDADIPAEILALWPGPLTLVVPLKESSPLADRAQTAAFRCPGDSWLRQVVALVGRPLYSSSANRSGRPVLSDIAAIEREFSADVALIVRDGDKGEAVPSTIIALQGGAVSVVRQGAVHIPGSPLAPSAC